MFSVDPKRLNQRLRATLEQVRVLRRAQVLCARTHACVWCACVDDGPSLWLPMFRCAEGGCRSPGAGDGSRSVPVPPTCSAHHRPGEGAERSAASVSRRRVRVVHANVDTEERTNTQILQQVRVVLALSLVHNQCNEM